MFRPGLIERVARSYRKRGMRGTLQRILHRPVAAPSEAYQTKLEGAFETRWQMISAHIGDDAFSLLDIGCNLGTFTAQAARSGLWALGLEMSEPLVRKAQLAHGGVENCGFMRARLDLATCARMPSFDVTLVLSVHHHWHQAFGPAVAAEMLRTVVSKTNRVLFFEGASRRERYLRDLPDFLDNDEASLVRYYDDYLRATVGDLVSEIELLGKSPCVGEREPFRWMYKLAR